MDAVEARLEAQSEKLDAIHISIEKDIGELKGMMHEQGSRLSKAELRLAQLQGMGAALAFGMPFIALALERLIN